MRKHTVAGIAAVAVALASAPSLTAQTVSLEAVPGNSPSAQVALLNSHEYRLQSRINGREYRIQVALPPRYFVSPASDTTRYPVMYLLDGNLELPLMAMMFRLTNRDSGQVILVGVGYPPGSEIGLPPPGGGQMPFRQRDYTPPPFPTSKPENKDSPSQNPLAGGAPLFLRMLKEELIPLIDRQYRTTSDRGIHGHSLGGLFATYALFTDPDLFTRYAITSPSLWWDDASIFLRETELAKHRTSLRKTVFIGVGGGEGSGMTLDVWRLIATLCDYRDDGPFAGLKIIAEEIPDEYHSSAVPFSRALKALYPPYPGDSTITRRPCRGR